MGGRLVQKEFVIQNFKRFRPYLVANAPLERLHSGVMWAEGPVYFADLGVLLFSDVPGEKIYRYVDGQALTVFRQPSGNANGNTRDRQGRLLTCESGNRRVTRTEYNGTITVLGEHYQGKRLNSPNDIVAARTKPSGLRTQTTESSVITRETRRRARSGEDASFGLTQRAAILRLRLTNLANRPADRASRSNRRHTSGRARLTASTVSRRTAK